MINCSLPPPHISPLFLIEINRLFYTIQRGTMYEKGFPLQITNQMMWIHLQLHKNDQHLLHPSAALFCLGIDRAILHAPLRQLNYSHLSHVCTILELQITHLDVLLPPLFLHNSRPTASIAAALRALLLALNVCSQPVQNLKGPP